jgi:hypothetical protein
MKSKCCLADAVIISKKPVVIKAVQFTDENKNIVLHSLREKQQNISATFKEGQPALLIPTLEGEMIASLNDWIIIGVKGEIYPVKSDIFNETYEIIK